MKRLSVLEVVSLMLLGQSCTQNTNNQNSDNMNDTAKQNQVRHGLGTMPSFKKDEILKRDLRDITKYLKSLKQTPLKQ